MKDKDLKYMISIIIPVHNGKKWIDRCMSSILKQTIFERLEIILVENASTDKSLDCLLPYEKKYKNIFLYSTKQAGVSNARNIGLKAATGAYIAFIDVDDYIEDNYFDVLLQAFEADIDVVSGGYTAQYADKSINHAVTKKKDFMNWQAMQVFLREADMDPCVCGKIFRRNIVDGLQFDTSLIVSEDRWYMYQIVKRNCRIRCVPTAGYHYIMNEESVTNRSFSVHKLGAVEVYGRIVEDLRIVGGEDLKFAESALIDMKCRTLGEILYFQQTGQYQEICDKYQKDIRNYSITKKYKYSSKKHFVSFLCMRFCPKIYVYTKYGMRLQHRL